MLHRPLSRLMLGGVHGSDERAVYTELCEAVDEWIQLYELEGRPLPARHLFVLSKRSCNVAQQVRTRMDASFPVFLF